MSVSIFLAYMDYCKENHKQPELKELQQWKEKYNHR